jgi:D-arabinose 1-dehydrogenase-like Zn-dependent alcohol dehydrogenase
VKAVRLHDYNSPLHLDEVDYPKLTGPYDIIVKIKGAGVCRTDLHIQEGIWKDVFNPKLPFTLGHENVGIIEEVGNGVDWLSKGDQVILHPYITCRHCRACRAGNDMHCPNGKFPGLDGTDGGYAEFLKTSAYSAIKVPKHVDLVPMAPLADAGLTAYHAVKKISQYLYPGSSVAVIGIGGLGHIAVQLLKAITPARVIAIDVNEEKIKVAKELGADEGVIASEDGGVKEVLRLSGDGVDVVIDFVGEHGTPNNALKMLRKGGIYSIVGYGGEFKNTTLDFISREIMVVGNLVGTYNELAELVELYTVGKVKLIVQTFSLSKANEVLEMLKSGKIIGRAVLTP